MIIKGLLRVCKWVVFGPTNDYKIEKIGGRVLNTYPDWSSSTTYLANKMPDYVEYFEGPTQTIANRRVRIDVTYAGINPTEEEWTIFDESDGTSILRTFTVNHTYSSNSLTNSVLVTT